MKAKIRKSDYWRLWTRVLRPGFVGAWSPWITVFASQADGEDVLAHGAGWRAVRTRLEWVILPVGDGPIPGLRDHPHAELLCPGCPDGKVLW